jgi:hypothetical protein
MLIAIVVAIVVAIVLPLKYAHSSPVINSATQRSAIARAWKAADALRAQVAEHLQRCDYKGALAACVLL